MENLIKEYLNQKVFAVAGSFKNESKYAYKIFKMLSKKGLEVYPISPSRSEVDGKRYYASISGVPFDIDAVSIVTPPQVTDVILKECLQKGIKMVWLQPGAESENAVKFCGDNQIKVIHGVCVIMELI